MAGKYTNIITFSEERSYLVKFLSVLIVKKCKSDIIIINKIYELLKLLITKPPLDYYPNHKTLTENQIIIELPEWTDIRTDYNYYLTQNSQAILERFVYNSFNLMFELHMQELRYKIQFKHAVYNFIEQYDLSINSYEMLKKKDYRNRKYFLPENSKNISSVFNSLLSPECP
jgi:hypothetical protein